MRGNLGGGIGHMVRKKNILFQTLTLAFAFACHQNQFSAGALDDFSSFFEELMNADSDNAFTDLFNEEEALKSKTKTSDKKTKPGNTMPTPAQQAELSKFITQLMHSLDGLIKTTHPHHPSWGGAVYEQIKQHRHFLTNVESLLLHLQAIQQHLPAKEMTTFLAVLKKHTQGILDIVKALSSLPAPKKASLDDENAFLLGKIKSLAGLSTKQEQKRRINGFVGIAKKAEALSSELQKLFADPELKKIFPEPKKAAPYKPSYSSSRSYYAPPPSRSKSSSRSRDDDYSSGRSPYSSSYYDDDYYDYDSSPYRPASSADSLAKPHSGTERSSESPAKAPVFTPPKENTKADRPSYKKLGDAVEDLRENELVSTLQQTLADGSLLSNPSYFSTMARTFASLFESQKDGGFTALATQLKYLEKESEETLQFLAKIQQQVHQAPGTIPQTATSSDTPEEHPSPENTKEARASAMKAQGNYQEIKQGIASAVLRLMYTPTEHRVREKRSATSGRTRIAWMLPERDETADETPRKHIGFDISSNRIDQEDVLCRHGRQTFAKFLDMLSKKCGMATYIKTQESALRKEINQFEEQRKKKIDLFTGTLVHTALSAEHIKTIQHAVDELATLGYELQYQKPTIATYDLQLYRLSEHKNHAKTRAILTEQQEQNLEAGLGTTRYHVVNSLTGLSQALEKASATDPDLSPEALSKLSEAVKLAEHAWCGYITEKLTASSKLRVPDVEPAPTAQAPDLPADAATEETAGEEEAEDPVPVRAPTIPANTKRVFQGISDDQLKDLLGTIVHKKIKGS